MLRRLDAYCEGARRTTQNEPPVSFSLRTILLFELLGSYFFFFKLVLSGVLLHHGGQAASDLGRPLGLGFQTVIQQPVLRLAR